MVENPRALVHATTVMLGAAAKPFNGPAHAAVLILGPSGSGKSDLALRLIERGARLVSDDQTALFVEDGRLFAESPPPIRRDHAGNGRRRAPWFGRRNRPRA
jgi:serine kinase of HPr protein (carbohydrate metabolism regulator)